MKMTTRRAVSPVVATLLLIVISVVSGLTVYLFTSNLSGVLGNVGGQQITEIITVDAYTFTNNPPTAANPLIMAFRNSGGGTVTISAVYFDGIALTETGSPGLEIPTHQVLTLGFSTTANPVPIGFNGVPANLQDGSTHTVKVVTSDGAKFSFNVVTGGTG